MQRVALEAVLRAGSQLVRVTTTHLAYYSLRQRAAQVERLRELHAEAAGHMPDLPHAEKLGGPFETFARPAAGILTADFNYRPDDPLHSRMMAPFADGTPAYHDAWALVHGNKAHAPTIGVHDREQWPEAFCCDFIYVSGDIAPRVRGLNVDLETAASDHQPVLLEIDL
jgi:endonuclease/exonuclease/phosphatase family metal-dependent hydrolase